MAKTPDEKPKKKKPPTLQVVTTEDLLRDFRVATIQRGTDMTKAINAFMTAYIAADAPTKKGKR